MEVFMRVIKPSRFILVFVLVLMVFLPIMAADDPGKVPKPLDPRAIDEWKSIRSTVLTHNGRWMAYYLIPNDGDAQVILREVKGTREYTFKAGKTRSGKLAFSEDSRWLAFMRYPSKTETKKAEKSKKPSKNKLVLVKLADGKENEYKKIRSFAFSGKNGKWLAMAKYADKKGKEAPKGADLILRELATGNEFNFGNISVFAFNKSGQWLAMAIDAADQAGNGIWLRHMASGRLLVMDSGKAFYERLKWTEKGDGLALLKGVKNDEYKNKLYQVLALKKKKKSRPEQVVFDQTKFKNFPADFTLSPNRSPAWSEDLTGISFGIHDAKLTDKAKKKREEAKKKKQQKKEAKDKGIDKDKSEKKTKAKTKADKPDLPKMVIWHWKDKRLQSQQWKQEKRDKNYSYLCYFRPADKQFFRLADDEVRTVVLAAKENYAVGYDNETYLPMGNMDGRRYRDIYVFNLKTGKRKKVLEKSRWSFGISPDGSHLLYYKDSHFYTYDMQSNQHYNITKGAPVSFVNIENDLNIKNPPIRPRGWLKNGKAVLLSDNWDLWKIPVHGGMAVNLTVNGKKKQIRYRFRFRLDRKEKGIDFSQPQYFRMYAEWTKKCGIARIDRGRPGVKVLLWDDAQFNRLLKAENAPVFVYTRETNSDYPDYYSTNANLSNGRRLTNANPQQADYAWCPGYKIINYQNDRGQKLQGIIYLPAGYEEGKSYPTILYMYEKLSRNANRYPSPRLWVYEHTFHTSNGYAVLNPDITFAINDPGKSSVGCIMPALDAAVATGIVDPKNVGIHGHSWGGYQTAFIITQTKRFKAAIAGAALTNMISMYSSVYWNSGGGNMAIFESSQGRFRGGYWDNLEAYQRNSPVYYAQKVETPLLMLHNDKDGAVDYNQGIEYYNTLRRLGKPVVMLEYKGENHGLRKPENLKDYLWRIKQFFDHHLKGAQAPPWWSEGIDYLDLETHLKEQKKLYTPKDKKKTDSTGKKKDKKKQKTAN